MTTKKKTSSSSVSIEESLQRLEEIADLLQEGKLPLEESLALYEEGLTLTRACAERLQQASLTVRRLEKDLAGTLKIIDDSADLPNE
jgi:exodeoxyribonuclease VII small subunit